MAWIVLMLSAVCEAIWATALGYSDGFTVVAPTIVFGVALTASMAGLGWAMRQIPIGTAYAVWVGVGAALTVAYAMLAGDEVVSAWKIVFIGGIIAAVIGLKLVPARAVQVEDDRADTPAGISRAAPGGQESVTDAGGA